MFIAPFILSTICYYFYTVCGTAYSILSSKRARFRREAACSLRTNARTAESTSTSSLDNL